jgi:O-antigen ligase
VAVLLFLFFVVLLPFEGLDVFGTGDISRVGSIPKLAGYALALAMCLSPRWILYAPHPAVRLFAAYFGLLVLHSLLIGTGDLSALSLNAFQLAQGIVLLHLLVPLMREKRRAGHAFLCYGVSAAMLAWLQVAGYGAVEVGSERTSSIGWDPNNAGAIYSCGIVCLLAWFVDERRKPALALLVVAGCTIPLALGIGQTGSRGAVIALVGGAATLALFAPGGRKTKLLLACGVAGVLVVAWGGAEFAGLAERLERTYYDMDTAQRDRIWMASLEVFLQRPLLGWGPAENLHQIGFTSGLLEVTNPHNIVFWILTETGVVGAVLYFLALGSAVRPAYRAAVRGISVGPLALAVTLIVVSLGVDWHFRKTYWLGLGFCLGSACWPLPGAGQGRPQLEDAEG